MVILSHKQPQYRVPVFSFLVAGLKYPGESNWKKDWLSYVAGRSGCLEVGLAAHMTHKQEAQPDE